MRIEPDVYTEAQRYESPSNPARYNFQEDKDKSGKQRNPVREKTRSKIQS